MDFEVPTIEEIKSKVYPIINLTPSKRTGKWVNITNLKFKQAYVSTKIILSNLKKYMILDSGERKSKGTLTIVHDMVDVKNSKVS